MVLGSAFRILLLLLVALAAAPARAAPEHAIAMLSQPKYGPDFTHFDYANPNAPKGGTLAEFGDRHVRQPEPVHRQGRGGGRRWA